MSGRSKLVHRDRLHELQGLVAKSISTDAAERFSAEKKLSAQVPYPDYALGLLSLVRYTRAHIDIRCAAAVLFKDLLRLRWPKPEPSPNADHRPLPAFEREIIKENFLHLLLDAPDGVQPHVADALALAAASEFPSSWTSILPSIVSSLCAALQAGDFTTTNADSLLTAVYSLFSRFRNPDHTNFSEIESCADVSWDTLFNVAHQATSSIYANAAAPLKLRYCIKSLCLCLFHFLFTCEQLYASQD